MNDPSAPVPARLPRGPYAHAPRLPGGEGRVALADLVQGEWFELEVGPGPKAGFLLERAEVEPRAALVGLEIRRKWATVGDQRLAQRGFARRARVFCEDARFALPRLGPDGSVRHVFLHFPDPWWKKRHSKRLVVGDVFLTQVARLLSDDGLLFVQTDVEERAELYETFISACAELAPAGEVEGSARLVENAFGARSPREHRAIADGLPVHRLAWRRVRRK